MSKLNRQVKHHMEIILRCTAPSSKYGRLLLASRPTSRYPYVYPRDTSCAVQLFRRLAGSSSGYDVADQAFELMKSMAHFMKDVISPEGNWGQRYSLDGDDKSLYKQEDNVAHGVAIICNYLLSAHRLKKEIEDIEKFLHVIDNDVTGDFCTSGPSASLVPLGRWVIRMIFLAIFFSYLSSKLRNLLGSSSSHHDLLFLSTLLLAAPGWFLRPAESAL